MSIELQHITKHFESFTALHDVNLSVAAGELMALLGPSGCGKTTLLRIIAGLEAPDHGCVRFYRQDSTAQGVRERQVGFVFQHYALFRHLTIAENVDFASTCNHAISDCQGRQSHTKSMTCSNWCNCTEWPTAIPLRYRVASVNGSLWPERAGRGA